MLSALQCWHESGCCHGDVRWEYILYCPRPPGRWVLVNMETSCRAHLLSRENLSAQWRSCCHDLFQLSVLMSELLNTKIPDGQTAVAHTSSESLNAEKVRLMLSRMSNSRTKNLGDMVAAVLST